MNTLIGTLGPVGLAAVLTVVLIFGTKGEGEAKALSWGWCLFLSVLAGASYAAGGWPFTLVRGLVNDGVTMLEQHHPRPDVPGHRPVHVGAHRMEEAQPSRSLPDRYPVLVHRRQLGRRPRRPGREDRSGRTPARVMSTAHLHAVPDPEPDPDDPPADEDAGEYPGLLRSLLPYCDPRPLAELGPLAVEMGRVGGPPLARAFGRLFRAIGRMLREIGRMLRWYGRGVLVLLILLTGWLSGSIGKRGSVGARLAGAGLAVYGIAKTCMEFPAAPWITLVAALAAVVLASTGRIKVPERKPGRRTRRRRTRAGRRRPPSRRPRRRSRSGAARPPWPRTSTRPGPGAAADSPAPFRERPRRGRGGGWPPRPPTSTSTRPPSQPQPPEEVPIDAPSSDTRAGPAGCISGSTGPSCGRHLPGISPRPPSQGARQPWISAGIDLPPVGPRKTVAGNGPGVHRASIPPAAPRPEAPPRGRVAAGQGANANARQRPPAPRNPREAVGCSRTTSGRRRRRRRGATRGSRTRTSRPPEESSIRPGRLSPNTTLGSDALRDP